MRRLGHNVERRAFGGCCYFNNAAIAAYCLSRYGRVAVLDPITITAITLRIVFYDCVEVLLVSQQGFPRFGYPHFSGFRDDDAELIFVKRLHPTCAA